MEQYIEFIGNHPVLSLIWIGLVFAIVLGWVKSQFSAIKQISTQELTHLVNREEGKVVDIRPLKDFNQSHIAGSLHLLSEKAKQNDFVGIEKHKENPIILVCVTGMTANSVAPQFVKAGFTNVSILRGGINAWQNASLPLTNGK